MMRALLERNGFRIRGSRADCIHCEGGSRGTVSFSAEVAFCHRCKWTANAAQLAGAFGEGAPPESPEHREARLRVEGFKQWLSETYQQAADEEYQLSRKAELGKKILARFPDCEAAWEALARWYHAERRLAAFFELAQCKAGRFALFEKWVSDVGN